MSAPSSGSGTQAWLERLGKALAYLDPECDTAELSRRVVEAAHEQFGMPGARLWRVQEGGPSVWQEIGSLEDADAGYIRGAMTGAFAALADGNRWTCALPGDGVATSALEISAGGPLDEAAQSVLMLFGRYAGVALASSERRGAMADLQSIIEATKSLNSTIDLAELINIILRLASRQTGAKRATVFLVDTERQEIWSLVGLGLEQQEIRMPISQGLAGWAASHGQTVNIEDAYQDSRFDRAADQKTGFLTRSVLCHPIRNNNEQVVGVLQLLNKNTGAFNAGDQSFLEAISLHVALALENARMHRAMLAQERLERDLALARSIQSSLLPDTPPQLAEFEISVFHRPTQMVGGDYYDFLMLDQDTLLTVVADVEGKGVASALMMSNLQAMLHTLVGHLHSLERLVEAINNLMASEGRQRKFMSMFVAMLDRRHRGLHYINAGHVPPAVIRANGKVESLREGGMVIGVLPGQTYERGFLRLEKGDVFIACTDGITEAMNRAGDEYGLERLEEAVSRHRQKRAQDIVTGLLKEVDEFSRGGAHEDDRVVLILKVV
ncbi:MAG TPA: GAF domain-containing SpoIIE family protein phosphatase [Candidatus Acidoferrales bacterium]|nr:GAF domain-containing SpoIIE family protein phosphatase [Candidatus Acidoferrales bacterium]